MALLDIMNAFSRGSAPAPEIPAAGVPQPTAPAPAAQPPQPGSGTVPPGAVSTTPAPAAEASPLDQFSELWKNDPNAAPPAPAGVYGSVKPEDVMASASKVNFANVVKPETLQAIQAGGDGAVKALGEALNSVSQAVFANSSLAATKLIDKALVEQQANMDKIIEAKFKQLSFSNNLRESNPVLNHPAAAPMVTMLEQQFASKYPNASSAELTKMAQDYFTTTFKALSATETPAPSATPAAQETDWFNFISS